MYEDSNIAEAKRIENEYQLKNESHVTIERIVVCLTLGLNMEISMIMPKKQMCFLKYFR